MKLRDATDRIKQDVITVYFIARDARTPLPIRLFALAIAAYACSPVDLIPDFIPIIGLLDDLIVLPIGISLVIKLAPTSVVEESRLRAQQIAAHPVSNIAAAVIVATWILVAAILGYWLFDTFRPEQAVPTKIIDR